ncbi:ATP-binding cassette sub-family G member 2 [Armadillidium nasatum]|uniref:ATP-binding cassette sub-family G member 2 n=1 Tax=Armadillidium nasatum TaxID=96803 RepID=A0A5N5STL0_9CRUS|nr:ATP-binding cassette sub-family G member 2 [Armadillidium nasatum]
MPGYFPNSRVEGGEFEINALIEDLGLEQVKHTRVKDLTLSEKRRLNAACHLLLETDIVLLDQPTKGMDIFDTFFLVEYLRQWAARGRIVILTIQPPTYEIFTMISRVALISTGRLMYFGKRREMLPYFAYIEYPCPAYKNPSDYYSKRAMIYQFPYNMLHFLGQVIVAAIMSVFAGAIFLNLRNPPEMDQSNINNRVAFYYYMSCIGIWPTLLMSISEAWRDKPAIERDISDGLYSRGIYIITKMCYSFPTTVLVYLAYTLPAYTMMAGFRGNTGESHFYLYIGYQLLYLLAIRGLILASSVIFDSRNKAAMLSGLFMVVIALGAGYTVHPKDISLWASPTLWWSPARWFMREMVYEEFNKTTLPFTCSRNPVDRGDIVKKVEVWDRNEWTSHSIFWFERRASYVQILSSSIYICI